MSTIWRVDREEDEQSKFNCVSKQTGYYADEELNCEVFHYCQDNVKHSWKSSKYHFVNEYLYRPINEEEVQRKPNVSLKYSDRYYPQEVYRDDRYEQEDDEEEVSIPTCTSSTPTGESSKYHFVNESLYGPINEEEVQRKPNVSLKYSDRYYPQEYHFVNEYLYRPINEEEVHRKSNVSLKYSDRYDPQDARPSPSPRPQAPQVFRSAEEVNIPLGQRRPTRPYDFDF
ncbi:Uncharacterized protein OBRU01_07859 [Operophtera brumata]|uniref:Uncharacterized protein n=1 Tax=Operophtera brumata TaxID=104452 RepID=A0A0L7LJ31_OPEBR|nr:Uncharacterized protein OBRU01_07859 [Operophtera brumata]